LTILAAISTQRKELLGNSFGHPLKTTAFHKYRQVPSFRVVNDGAVYG
jgi:hypothetical protein